MSTIQSLDDNYYIKEYDNIERYLLRIIKRYFDLEELNSMESINAIISEAINRYKASLIYKPKDVLTLNNKYGIVNFDLNDVNGELKFSKANAFNKDFGNEEDTICEGNDPRLSDDREPTEHHHKMEDVIGLIEALENLNRNLSIYKYHYHKNRAVLDKIIYSNAGPLDLKKLETLWFIVEGIINNIRSDIQTLKILFNKERNFIDARLAEIYDLSEALYLHYEESKTITERDIKRLIETNAISLQDEYQPIIDNLVDNPDKLLNDIKSSLCLIGSQEINFGVITGYIKDVTASEDSESMRYMYDHSNVFYIDRNKLYETPASQKSKKWIFDEENKCFESVENISMFEFFLSDKQFEKYDFSVKLTSADSDNDLISVIIATVGETDNPDGYFDFLDQPGIPPFSVISLDIMGGNESTPYNNNNKNIMINYRTGFSNQETLLYDSTQPTINKYWNGGYIYVRIVRNKSHFTIYRSNFDNPFINDTPIFDFDLKDFSVFNNFENGLYKPECLNKSQYGLGAWSQKQASFRNFKFIGLEEAILEDRCAQVPLDINKNSIINNALISASMNDFNLRNMEIKSFLLYNDSNGKQVKQQLPYIDNNLIIYADIINDSSLTINLKKITLDDAIEVPDEVIYAKILLEFYSNIYS